MSDSYSSEFAKSIADTFSTTDVFSRVVDYSRSFADVATITEALSKEFSRPLADSATVTDADARHFYKNVTGDSVSFSDSLVIQIVSAEAQLLNNYVLNFFTLNGP